MAERGFRLKDPKAPEFEPGFPGFPDAGCGRRRRSRRRRKRRRKKRRDSMRKEREWEKWNERRRGFGRASLVQ